MSFLDDLESNLKSMESREERGEQKSRDAKSRDSERARTQASAGYAEQLRKGPYAPELMKHATRLGHAMRTKVHLAWLGANLRLRADRSSNCGRLRGVWWPTSSRTTKCGACRWISRTVPRNW